MEIKVLCPQNAFQFMSLTLSKFQAYLFQCGNGNVVAVGALKDGLPVGLAIAVTNRLGEKLDPIWSLTSFFVSSTHRGQGAGSGIWQKLSSQVESKGCKRLTFQGILKEKEGESFGGFFQKYQECKVEKIAQIYTYDKTNVIKSPFVKGAMAGVFQPPNGFDLISWDGLNIEYKDELKANEGNWYPDFVSPLIGNDKMNEKCTVFAVDNEEKKIAGWITVLDVNVEKDLLYRTFFARAEYRTTQIGFHLMVEAVKNHLQNYEDRRGLSSIPLDNEHALRFSRLFFRKTYSRISYEYVVTMELMKKDEGFVKMWEKASENKFPYFPNVNLQKYYNLTVFLYDTGAGRLPVLHMKDREEFEDILHCILCNGGKKTFPKSMGAMMVKNWKDIFGQNHRVIVICDDYYSNISPEDMGLPPSEWQEKSYRIRLAHEGLHYYTLRIYGFINTGLMDEFIADTAAITAVFGEYRAAYFLRFMGLENYPKYKSQGRLENYLPKGFKEEQLNWQSSKEFTKMKEDAYRMSMALEAQVTKRSMNLKSEDVREKLIDGLCREQFFIGDAATGGDIGVVLAANGNKELKK